MKSYIYLDVLFFVNLTVNYVMLFAAGKATGHQFSIKRAILVSSVGGLYSILALVLPFRFCFGFLARIIFGLLMVAFTYPKVRGVSLVILAGFFYVFSTVVAGTAIAIYLRGKAALIQYNLCKEAHWWVLGLSLATVICLSCIWRLTGLSAARKVSRIGVEIVLHGSSISVMGMIDTGNSLSDPISGLPVIVVDWNSLKTIVPHESSYLFLSVWDSSAIKSCAIPKGMKFRLIPYTSVTGNTKIMPSFKPDALFLTENGKRVEKDAVIGVCDKLLSPHGHFQALLHPDLVN